jgi:hypothetical protein
MRGSSLYSLSILLLLTVKLVAKDQPVQTVVWPETGTPVVRFTFGKFKEIGAIGNQHTFMTDTTAENVWTKSISDANFTLYLFDKSKNRIGEALLTVSNVKPGETIKFGTTVVLSGPPTSLSVDARYLPAELRPAAPARTISITVNSVPQGAALKVDGADQGITPKMIQVGIGKHLLEFSKEGFSTGHFPLEVGPNDTSGGSVSYELGTSAYDTVELRDGTVLSGDLMSVSSAEVVIRIGGASQHFNRNQVKRILLVERDAPAQ